jgi:hypothetical protein
MIRDNKALHCDAVNRARERNRSTKENKIMKSVIAVTLIALSMVATCFAKKADSVVLLPKDAVIEGTTKYYKEKGFIGSWNQPENTIKFKVPELNEGKYKILVKYAAPDDNGGKISVKLNDEEFKRAFGSTGGWGILDEKSVGYLKHPGGLVDITLTILQQNEKNKAVINLHSMTLEKM